MATSKTEKDNDIVDDLIGSTTYVTTITDEHGNKTEGRGNTSEESQKVASEKVSLGKK